MKKMVQNKETWLPVIAGIAIGIAALILGHSGNPGNMGICVACFWRDIAGGLGLHSAEVVQYLRPEIPGFILGAFIIASIRKESKAVGGSAPLIRFFVSFFVMIGALVFLGCPLRMILRLASGDLNAFVGLLGFIVGILGGSFFLKKGFSLGRAYEQPAISKFVMPVIAVTLLVFVIIRPAFIRFSQEGPGSMAAPIGIALICGLVIGGLAQQSRLCMAGGIRDVFLIKNYKMLLGYVSIFVVVLIGNLVLGGFKLGFAEQPIAHSEHLWNFLGMVLVGLGSTLIGGCPLRQTILAGEGNADSAIAVLGLVFGAAFAHNFGLASSAAGTTFNGRVAVLIGLVFMLIIAATSKRRKG